MCPKLKKPGVTPKAKIASLADARWDRSKGKALNVLRAMSEEDRETLQNDKLGRDPDRKGLPSALKEFFMEWLRDHYNPFEREEMMALERQGETERKFLEEVVDAGPGEYEEYALAKAALEGCELKLVEQKPAQRSPKCG